MNMRDEIRIKIKDAIPSVDATNESSLSCPRSLSNTSKAAFAIPEDIVSLWRISGSRHT